MSDATVAAIARRVAVAAAVNGYERSPEAKQKFQQALTELCAAVKTEQAEEIKT